MNDVEQIPAELLEDLRTLKAEATIADLHAQLAKARYERGCAVAFLSMGLQADDSINVDTGVVTRAPRPAVVVSESNDFAGQRPEKFLVSMSDDPTKMRDPDTGTIYRKSDLFEGPLEECGRKRRLQVIAGGEVFVVSERFWQEWQPSVGSAVERKPAEEVVKQVRPEDAWSSLGEEASKEPTS